MTPVFLALDPNVKWYLTLALVVVGALVGVVWAHRVWTDLKGGRAEETTADPVELLTPLAQAYAAGQMSEEEYHRIQASLGQGEATAARPGPAALRPRRDQADATGSLAGEGPADPPLA